MAIVYLGLGSNLGNKENNFNDTILLLNIQVGNILSVSKFYKSEPVGFKSENNFLNAVVSMSTDLTPYELLKKTQDIEKILGRTKKSNGNYSDRIIDIDILFYNQLQLSTPNLTIPHPLMHERSFVLLPMREIAPDLVHPVIGKTILELSQTFINENNNS